MGKTIVRQMVIALTLLLGFAQSPACAVDDSAVCGVETARQEHQQAVPDRLLHAISLIESGRWDSDRKEVFAWPWTVMAEGEGRFLPSKAAAIAEVRKLQARGVKNIDVGCMQVNLQAHADAFATLDDAFDPAHNVAYAAQFLIGLYQSVGDWQTAGAFYHSQTPDLAASYKAKLVNVWTKLRAHADSRLALATLPAQNRPPLGLPRFVAADSTMPVLSETSRAVANERAAAVTQLDNAHSAAQKLADAYRRSKIAEYEQHKAQMASGGHPTPPAVL